MPTVFQGTLRRLDLGTGGWALESGGERYVLVGDVPAELAGRAVRVTGRALPDGASFLMAGKLVEVSRVEPS